MAKQHTHNGHKEEGVNLEQTLNESCESSIDEAETQTEPYEEPSLEEKIAELQAKLAETSDQLLRKAADFENFRKRMNQEKQNAIEFANQSLLLDIIPAIDDFERAIQSAESSKDFTVLLDGVKMIEKQLSSQLENKWGLKRFNSAGELFDPNIHEALMMEKSPNVSEATVLEDLIKGYWLKNRLIRAAKVKVVMPEKASTASAEANAVDEAAESAAQGENGAGQISQP